MLDSETHNLFFDQVSQNFKSGFDCIFYIPIVISNKMWLLSFKNN